MQGPENGKLPMQDIKANTEAELQRHPFVKSARLVGLTLRPLYSGDKALGRNSLWGLMSPKSGLDALEKPGIEPNYRTH